MWYPFLAQQEFLAEKKQTAFPLLMFPIHARIGLPARGEQPVAFRVSPKLDAGTVAQMHQRSVYALAFLAACRLPEEWASP